MKKREFRQSKISYFISRFSSYIAYKFYLKTESNRSLSKNLFSKGSSRDFCGYPANHNFYILENRLIPSFKLFERYNKISRLYPNNMTTLLDISACRGFYVLEASLREKVNDAIGIDLVESFISECNVAKNFVNAKKASFHVSNLQDLHQSVMQTNELYQVVIFTGSYHYFFWGSDEDQFSYMDHDKILSMLADITSQRVIFSGRLDYDDLSEYPQRIAKDHRLKEIYTTQNFLECAEKYFDVKHVGYLGKALLFTMDKKQTN